MSKVYTLRASIYYIRLLIERGEEIQEIRVLDDDIIDIETNRGKYIVRDSGDGASISLYKVGSK